MLKYPMREINKQRDEVNSKRTSVWGKQSSLLRAFAASSSKCYFDDTTIRRVLTPPRQLPMTTSALHAAEMTVDVPVANKAFVPLGSLASSPQFITELVTNNWVVFCREQPRGNDLSDPQTRDLTLSIIPRRLLNFRPLSTLLPPPSLRRSPSRLPYHQYLRDIPPERRRCTL